MTKIRIGVDIRELQKGIMTGIGRYLLNFLKIAPRYKPEWEFVPFCNQNTRSGVINDNFKYVVIKEGLTFYWDQIKLPLALIKEKIDLFLSPYNKVPLVSPCRVIITIHDMTPFLSNFAQEPRNPLCISLKKYLSNLMAKRADLIITDSTNSKKDIICLFNLREEKVRVVYNGVEKRFCPIKDREVLERIREEYGITKNYILYIGNLKPHKNVSGLIKAYSMLSESLKNNYQLVIVGKKDENFNGLFDSCAELRIIDKVIFIDFVKDDDLPALYSSATIFVFPSFYEGFGLPVLEAMACDVPVITSSVASLPEVAGNAARFINPYSTEEISRAIEELLVNLYLREDLTMKGLRQARNFSLDKMAKNILDLMEELL